MRTFAQQPKAAQQTTSAKLALPVRAHFGRSHDADSILQLQRAVGNQAMARLLQSDSAESNAVLTGTTSPRFEHSFGRFPARPPAAGPLQTKHVVQQGAAAELGAKPVSVPEGQLAKEARPLTVQRQKATTPKPRHIAISIGPSDAVAFRTSSVTLADL